jgi:tRNA A58 N-methylase Trm61
VSDRSIGSSIDGAGGSRSALAEALRSVPGWLELDEAWGLHESARTAAATGDPLVVEIGSFKGRSAIALGLGLKAAGGKGRVIAIDPHDLVEGQFEDFVGNIRRAGVDDVVEPIRSTSHAARHAVPDGAVRVLFVDGSHEYDDVVQDVRDWESALSPDAVVAFNDPYWRQVSRALEETVGQSGSYREPRWCANTLFLRFRPGAPRTARDAIAQRRLRAYLKLGRRWLEMHNRIVADPRIPLWMKRAQLRLARGVFSLILPRMR